MLEERIDREIDGGFHMARHVEETLRELLHDGKITPVVERTYPLEQVADALEYMGEGHARAKLVLTI